MIEIGEKLLELICLVLRLIAAAASCGQSVPSQNHFEGSAKIVACSAGKWSQKQPDFDPTTDRQMIANGRSRNRQKGKGTILSPKLISFVVVLTAPWGCTTTEKTNPVESDWVETFVQYNSGRLDALPLDELPGEAVSERIPTEGFAGGFRRSFQTVYRRCQNKSWPFPDSDVFDCHSGQAWGLGVEGFHHRGQEGDLRFNGARVTAHLDVIVLSRFGVMLTGKLGTLKAAVLGRNEVGGWTYGHDISLYLTAVKTDALEWRVVLDATEDMMIPRGHVTRYKVPGLAASTVLRWALRSSR